MESVFTLTLVANVVFLIMLLAPIAHYWFKRVYLPSRKRKREARELVRKILERGEYE
jgi:hypothetical protein